jgi:hypothetical protein
MRVSPSFALAGLLLLAPNAHPAAPSDDKAGLAFFESKIRPVLAQQCYSCHSAGAKKSRGGLRVDTREALRKGGDSGPALTPGKPESSLLIKALRHDEVAMPPKSKLPDAVVADFVRWVAMGAPDPRDGKAGPARTGVDLDAGRRFWAFQPPRSHPAPAVRLAAWPRTGVDRFVLAALEAKGLRPVGDAGKRTLLRRVYLDLVGLPPPPAEIEAFVRDDRPDAFERVVDRLLASPAFGERWGRHWLDAARYADSNGKDENFTFYEAWRYRDYVLAAVNADKPFDRFVREQIAGDLLPAGSQRQRDEQLTATGFLVLGPKVLFDRDKLRQKMDVVDEQIDTVGRTFMGLTLGCARCHDHKFDPVPTRDYYALAGILASTRTVDGTKLNNPLISGWSLRPLGADGEARLAAYRAHQARIAAAAGRLKKAQAGKAPADELRALEAEQRRLAKAAPPAPPLVMAVRDEAAPADVAVNIRGNPHSPGDRVPRGFLRVASVKQPAPLPPDQSGRRELADWVASRENPLTARVFVNRVWMHLFGEGLVRTIDDFGAQGERPSHPELLDHLAVRFAEGGWSLKKLVRTLVLSRTYQLALAGDADAVKADPDNRLLWRANSRRLEAEVIRDAMLSVAGRLDRTMGGSSVAGLGVRAIDNDSKGGAPTDDNTRRSVYLPVVRNGLPVVFEVFDFADPDVAVGKRNSTTVAPQALFLMNSPLVMDLARGAADRLLRDAPDDDRRVGLLYRRALGRPATAQEVRQAVAFVKAARADSGETPSGEAEAQAWAAVCQAVFGCAEFRSVE